VLVDGEPVNPQTPDAKAIWQAKLHQLEENLDQPLLYVAELDEESVAVGEQDQDLPETANLPGDGLLLTLPLLGDGELRIFEPDRAEGDRGRMWVLDVHGVALRIRQRADGLYVHVDDSDGASRPPAGVTDLLVEVRNAGEQEHRL
jgi:hypothetical protein